MRLFNADGVGAQKLKQDVHWGLRACLQIYSHLTGTAHKFCEGQTTRRTCFKRVNRAWLGREKTCGCPPDAPVKKWTMSYSSGSAWFMLRNIHFCAWWCRQSACHMLSTWLRRTLTTAQGLRWANVKTSRDASRAQRVTVVLDIKRLEN